MLQRQNHFFLSYRRYMNGTKLNISTNTFLITKSNTWSNAFSIRGSENISFISQFIERRTRFFYFFQSNHDELATSFGFP